MDLQTLTDLRTRLVDPGFTPAVRDVGALIEVAKEDVSAGHAERAHAAITAIASIQGPVVRRVASTLAELPGDLVASLIEALRKRKDRSDEAAFVILCGPLLTAPETRTRRSAARALGEAAFASEASEATLRAALDRTVARDERAALLRALARLGAKIEGEDASTVESDPRAAKHRVIAARDKARGKQREPTSFELLDDVRVVWLARVGLESILAQELAARLGAHLREVRVEPGRVSAFVSGSSEAIGEARCALAWGLDIGRIDEQLLSAARVLDGPVGRAVSAAMGLERPRFRVETTDARGRARPIAKDVVWRIAEAFRADRESGPINDPTRAELVLRVEGTASGSRVLLIPNRTDVRFSYRTADVLAASHPTIAAALARASRPEAHDVVWDPFVGSGLELCERALLHPYAELIGTDLDPAAIEKARRNLASVAPNASLRTLDARRFDRRGITAVITNPPLGRRVGSDQTVPGLLGDVCSRISTCLAPRGRVALVSPKAELTRDALSRGGLTQRDEYRIDMGGFDAYLQVFERLGSR